MQARVESVHSLSPIQKDFLAGFLIDPERRAYLSQWIGFYSEPIDLARWKQAWETVVQRHGILRTAFDWENPARPLQVVLTDVSVEVISHRILETNTLADFRTAVESIAGSRYQKGIDIRKPPLMDFEVVTSSEWSAVIWTRHHLITDGWSLSKLYEEILTTYADNGNNSEGFKKTTNYGSYLNVLEPLLNQEESRKYWEDYLVAGSKNIYNSQIHRVLAVHGEANLTEAFMTSLRKASRTNRVTLNTLFLTTLADGLCRTLGLEQVCLGMAETISGVMEEEETIIGPKITTLPIFGTILQTNYSAEQLINTHRQLLSHRSHSLTTISEICNNNPEKISAYGNLLNNCYVFQNYPLSTDLTSPGWPQLTGEIDRSEPGSPLLFVVEPTAKAGKLRVVSKDQDFDAKTIERLLAEWQETLAWIVSNKNRESTSSPNHGDDRSKGEPIIGTQALLEKIRETAELTSTKVAIVTEEDTISYGELWEKVQEKSKELEEKIYIPSGLIMVESANQASDIMNILAVWNTGRGHLIVDKDIPAHEAFSIFRHDEVVARLSASGVVAKRHKSHKDETEPSAVKQQTGNNQLAYAILTSGSTGKPKLIGISQKNLEAHRQARRHRYRRDDRILLTYPLIFDGAITVLVSALEAGSTLVMAPKGPRADGRQAMNIDRILPTIETEQVTALNMIPSLLKNLLTHGDVSQLASVRHLVLAAEEVTIADWRIIDNYLPTGLEVWNEYGPSETTICATEYRIPRKVPIQESSVPIGKAIDGVTVEVVNEQGKAVNKGEKGEIWIRGAIVGQGYLGEPERSKTTFLKEQTIEGEICIYRSGDLGYIRESGDLVWVGRKDGQVKLNGVRTRTEEVEALLRSMRGTKEARSLILEEPGEERKMVSFVTLEKDQPHHQWLLDTEAILRARQLGHNLRILASIPRLESGKVNGQALRQLALRGESQQPGATAGAQEDHPERTEEKIRVQRLKELFSEVLNQEEISAECDLFRRGGSSLTAMTLTALVRKRLGLKMEIIDVFQAPTPKGLAALWDMIKARENSREFQLPQAKKRDRWAN